MRDEKRAFGLTKIQLFPDVRFAVFFEYTKRTLLDFLPVRFLFFKPQKQIILEKKKNMIEKTPKACYLF